jgi:hypothetical protein
MLIRLEELGLAHHRRNVIPAGVKPQPSAIRHAQAEPLVHASDWVMVFDADEFLCITLGDGRIDSLISAAGEAHGIVVTWRVFGSGGVVDWSPAPVTEQYTRAAPPDWNKGWGVKTLFRFDPDIWKLGIHRPTMKAKALKTDYPDGVTWLNGSGQPMEDYFKFRGWRSIRRTLGYDWAQMNHYAVKSVEAYAVRKMRGNVNLKADKYNADYWALQDRNEVEDRRILRHAPERARIAAELLADPVLARLHHAAIERVEARLAAFRRTEDYAALKASLLKASEVPITAITAKPPKARDPARIAALMSAVEKRVADRPKPGRRGQGPYLPAPVALSAGAEEVVNQGVRLPADPGLFAPRAIEAVRRGRFERRAARQRQSLLRADDRLLEIGAGIGFLPILSVLAHPGLVALAVEPRADLAAVARGIAAAHGLGPARIAIVDATLFGTDGAPAGLRDLAAGFSPTVIVLNDARLPPDDLVALLSAGVRRVVLPEEAEVSQHHAAALAALGFRTSSEGGAHVLDAP